MRTKTNIRGLSQRLLILCLLTAGLSASELQERAQARPPVCGYDTNCRICPEYWECDYSTCDCVCVSQFCCQLYHPGDPYCGGIAP